MGIYFITIVKESRFHTVFNLNLSRDDMCPCYSKCGSFVRGAREGQSQVGEGQTSERLKRETGRAQGKAGSLG